MTVASQFLLRCTTYCISIFVVADETKWIGAEGGPNWELFAPKGNRFYLPGSLGPAWQSAATTIHSPTLQNLVDFDSKVLYGLGVVGSII